jgi:hypothetical protein
MLDHKAGSFNTGCIFGVNKTVGLLFDHDVAYYNTPNLAAVI